MKRLLLVLAVLAGMLTALVRGMSWRDVIEGFVSGCKGVTIGAIVLALAVTLKSVADAVGTAQGQPVEAGDPQAHLFAGPVGRLVGGEVGQGRAYGGGEVQSGRLLAVVEQLLDLLGGAQRAAATEHQHQHQRQYDR